MSKEFREGDYLCLCSSLCNNFTRTVKAIMASAVTICAPVKISAILFIFDKLPKNVSSVKDNIQKATLFVNDQGVGDTKIANK